MSGEKGPATRAVTERAGLEQVYAVLLAPSFPPTELLPVEWLLEGVAAGRVEVLVSEDASGPIAVAVTERLGSTGAVLLTYFATRADMRGRGVGSALFAGMLQAVLERDHPTLVVAEVERPDRHTGSAAHGDPTARLRFYGRRGARVLDLPYFQPPIEEGGEPVHGMLLLALWVDPGTVQNAAPGAEGIPGPALAAGVVEEMLEDLSGQDPPEAVALRAAAREPVVGLYAVEDYARVATSR